MSAPTPSKEWPESDRQKAENTVYDILKEAAGGGATRLTAWYDSEHAGTPSVEEYLNSRVRGSRMPSLLPHEKMLLDGITAKGGIVPITFRPPSVQRGKPKSAPAPSQPAAPKAPAPAQVAPPSPSAPVAPAPAPEPAAPAAATAMPDSSGDIWAGILNGNEADPSIDASVAALEADFGDVLDGTDSGPPSISSDDVEPPGAEENDGEESEGTGSGGLRGGDRPSEISGGSGDEPEPAPLVGNRTPPTRGPSDDTAQADRSGEDGGGGRAGDRATGLIDRAEGILATLIESEGDPRLLHIHSLRLMALSATAKARQLALEMVAETGPARP